MPRCGRPAVGASPTSNEPGPGVSWVGEQGTLPTILATMPDQITVSLPDGSRRSLPAGSTAADLAQDVGRGLAKAAVAAKVDGALVDLTSALPDGSSVAIITASTPDGLHILRHSTAHVLAQAVCDLWPGAKYAIGPAIEDGFYYDFELPDGAHFSEDDLERIDARMRQIIAEGQPFRRSSLSVEEGLALFAGQPYKQEIIEGVDAFDAEEGVLGSAVSVYKQIRMKVILTIGRHATNTGCNRLPTPQSRSFWKRVPPGCTTRFACR